VAREGPAVVKRPYHGAPEGIDRLEEDLEVQVIAMGIVEMNHIGRNGS
jgi:hypothetical protein